MDAKTRRVLKTKQGKVSIGSGDVVDSEGYEGQVQVRDTKDGPMLFAKLKGKWIQSPLLPGGNFVTPKAYIIDTTMPASAGTITTVPPFIPIDNIIDIKFVFEWQPSSEIFKAFVSWNDFSGSEFRPVIKVSDRSITTGTLHSTLQNKKVKVTILYK